MISFGQVIFLTIIFWLVIIILASNIDLQKYNIFVSSGFLVWKTDRISRILDNISDFAIIEKIKKFSVFTAALLFFGIPILLLINMIKIIQGTGNPLIPTNPLRFFRAETFLLLLPSVFLILSLNGIYKGIIHRSEGNEIETSGLSLVVLILNLYVNVKEKITERRSRVKIASSIIVFNFLILLLLFPISTVTINGIQSQYQESEGAIIISTYPNSPADNIGLNPDQVIVKFKITDEFLTTDEIEIKSASDYYASLRRIDPGTEFVIELESGDQFTITSTSQPPNAATQTGSYLGLIIEDYQKPKIGWLPVLLPLWVEVFFTWMISLSLLFSFYNVLPFPKSQGKILLNEYSELWNKNISTTANKVILGIVAILLFFNLIGG